MMDKVISSDGEGKPVRVRDRKSGDGVMLTQGPSTVWLSGREVDSLVELLGELTRR